MNKNFKVVGGSLLGALALMAVSVMPASAADEGGTDATFTLIGGTLDVTVAGAAGLNGAASGATSITGQLGTVSVSNTRGDTVSWAASVTSTPFVSDTEGTQTTSSAIAYDSGTVSKTGTVTQTGLGSVAVPLTGETGANVVTGTAVVGNHTASWNPTLTVTLPASSLAGLYEGTVTTSVA